MVGKSNKRCPQRIDIPPPKKIEVECSGTCPDITISHAYNLAKMREYDIRLDTKVPKVLSILPQVTDDTVSTIQAREEGRIYVEVGETPSYATLEQIKGLNTKTVFVDKLTDTKINRLSNEDIVMLRKE
ncbi:hypothetical protein [Mycoplasmopsis bovirhinis]|uniref:hypothetical protein n=1 Tax=Mycoplasmopsis bovirhinis TaxID=29553 RepID=UPI000E70A44F|nr:hypothetical protein [Mycoplasmopsis bovirhinis]